ncbi:MAG TPA: alpha/beta hydrolase [Eubacteriales bacterium]|nr:alpha/beta hydrolase [Clostridia bacterium]HRV72470.1 alpha/beta hydrolase [Eubacteriales bacterium]
MNIVFKERRFPSATGICDIRYCIWQPVNEIRGAVQITHGMAEHIDRYNDFACFLAERGFLVYGMDMAGHGKSVKDEYPLGFFGSDNGWDNIIADMKKLRELVMKDHPAIPTVLFGHSMGSFLARSFAARHGDLFDAFIFSGTAGKNPALGIAKLIVNGEIKKGKGMQPSVKMDKLSFGSYNKQFKKPNTAFDWLSRNPAQVQKYVDDPLCGFVFTAYGFKDLLAGLGEVSEKGWASRVPQKPILMISGAMDPVGGNGKGVLWVEKRLAESGHTVCCKLYPDCRHELLNELNRDEVFNDVLLFLETICVMGEYE